MIDYKKTKMKNSESFTIMMIKRCNILQLQKENVYCAQITGFAKELNCVGHKQLQVN